MKKVLVAGGAGYIGSHTLVELIGAGYAPVVVDNLYNASEEAVKRVEEICHTDICFYKADVLDLSALSRIFEDEKPESVIMFAGYKAVGESVQKPIEYYYNNLTGLLMVLEAMRKHDCHSIIFSSSATVYGQPDIVPVTEESAVGSISNPYGRTKYFIEQILTDAAKADDGLSVCLLRYFNPVGAHPSGRIGEDPAGIPNNLMPYIAQVATEKRSMVHVFGNDYPTPDGTGVRDYIHVMDLAAGHAAALACCAGRPGLHIYNLGTGHGYSVLDVISAYEKACGKPIPYVIDPRRPGDIAVCYCDPSKAAAELGWKAKYGLDDMCRDSYRWQSMNPEGYGPSQHAEMCLQ